MPAEFFNWQRRQWPTFTFERGALRDELVAFARVFREAKKALRQPQYPLFVAKVSKPTATRDLAALVQSGAVVPDGSGPQTRYFLNHPAFRADGEPIDGINEGINDAVLRLVRNHPGRGVPFFLASVRASRATVERAVRLLVSTGRIEHRGSRKTGGYFAVENER